MCKVLYNVRYDYLDKKMTIRMNNETKSQSHDAEDPKGGANMEKKDFYEGEYMPQMHKIGKLT